MGEIVLQVGEIFSQPGRGPRAHARAPSARGLELTLARHRPVGWARRRPPRAPTSQVTKLVDGEAPSESFPAPGEPAPPSSGTPVPACVPARSCLMPHRRGRARRPMHIRAPLAAPLRGAHTPQQLSFASRGTGAAPRGARCTGRVEARFNRSGAPAPARARAPLCPPVHVRRAGTPDGSPPIPLASSPGPTRTAPAPRRSRSSWLPARVRRRGAARRTGLARLVRARVRPPRREPSPAASGPDPRPRALPTTRASFAWLLSCALACLWARALSERAATEMQLSDAAVSTHTRCCGVGVCTGWEKFSPTWERNCETRLAWMTSLQERLCFFRREERAVPSPKGLCHQNKLPLPISST